MASFSDEAGRTGAAVPTGLSDEQHRRLKAIVEGLSSATAADVEMMRDYRAYIEVLVNDVAALGGGPTNGRDGAANKRLR